MTLARTAAVSLMPPLASSACGHWRRGLRRAHASTQAGDLRAVPVAAGLAVELEFTWQGPHEPRAALLLAIWLNRAGVPKAAGKIPSSGQRRMPGARREIPRVTREDVVVMKG
jgi:hypothetical protein